MKIKVELDAVQWQPGVKIEGAKEIAPELIRRGGFFYVHCAGHRATHWLSEAKFQTPPAKADSVRIVVNDTEHFREVLSFAFWDVKGEKKDCPLDLSNPEHAELARDYVAVIRWPITHLTELRPSVILNYQGSEHFYLSPGDWVVTYPDGKLRGYHDADFRRIFGGAP